MRRVMILAATVLILAGSWNMAAAQAATSPKPAKTKKAPQARPVEEKVAVETAAVPVAAELDTAPAADTAAHDSLPKKKGGLFGKAKGVMKNKVVKQVAKVAACTMVPGGQVIAGAIDAASSETAGEAASGAAGAASGSSCMPGMGGAGVGGAGMGAAGLAGGVGGGVGSLAGVGMASALSDKMTPGAAAYAPGVGAPGMMPSGAYGMVDPKPMADCMGLTVEEYTAMTNPTAGEPRQMTKGEMKRQQQLSKKVGSQRQMTCSQTVGMQQANAQMAQVQQMMATAQQRGQTGMPQGMAGMPTAGGGTATTEAPGEQVALSPEVAAELAKGKTVVRSIDWVSGSAEVSPAAQAGFEAALTTLAQAIKASGQRYRLDLYMDEQYDEVAAKGVGPLRLQSVQSTLTAAIGDPGVVQAGKTKRDKNPRLEVIKVK